MPPPAPRHLPAAATEESQASEKSEASPSSTGREERRAVSLDAVHRDHGVGQVREVGSTVGTFICHLPPRGGQHNTYDKVAFAGVTDLKP